jgi:hypothetical protein
MKFDYVFAIASGQPDPLVLPFLTPEITCSHLILFVSEWSKDKGIDQNIKNAITPLGVQVTNVFLSSDSWSDIQNIIQQTVKNLPDKSIAFNANGGTKPMTMAAYEFCYNENIPVFYIDKNQLEWLYTAVNDNLTPVKIEQSLSINSYFLAHGYRVASKDEPLNSRSLKALVKDWASQKNKSAIGKLNYLASEVRVNNLQVKLNEGEASDNSDICSYLDDLDRDGLIDLNLSKRRVKFNSEGERFFISGGWYELYIYMLLQQINKKHFNGKGTVVSNIVVKPNDKLQKDLKNEIDVAFLLNNRLYLFECKTANLSSQKGRADVAIYKLGTILHEFGGIHAKGCITSYRDIIPLDKKRAKLLNIDIVEHSTSTESMEHKLYSFLK